MPPPRNAMPSVPEDTNATNEPHALGDIGDRQGLPSAQQDSTHGTTEPGNTQHSSTPQRTERVEAQDQEIKNMLVEVVDAIKAVKKVLIGSQNSLARVRSLATKPE
jgi:hypothetical protein